MKTPLTILALTLATSAHAQSDVLHDTVAVLTYEDGRIHEITHVSDPLPIAECQANRMRRLSTLMPYLSAHPELLVDIVDIAVVCRAVGESI